MQTILMAWGVRLAALFLVGLGSYLVTQQAYIVLLSVNNSDYIEYLTLREYFTDGDAYIKAQHGSRYETTRFLTRQDTESAGQSLHGSSKAENEDQPRPVTPRDVSKLKADPDLAPKFDAFFGEGMAAKYLGQESQDERKPPRLDPLSILRPIWVALGVCLILCARSLYGVAQRIER